MIWFSYATHISLLTPSKNAQEQEHTDSCRITYTDRMYRGGRVLFSGNVEGNIVVAGRKSRCLKGSNNDYHGAVSSPM